MRKLWKTSLVALALSICFPCMLVRAQKASDEERKAFKGPGVFIPYDMPYLQLATSDGIVVRWRSQESTDSVVKFGLAVDKLTGSAESKDETTQHEVKLTDLKPDTKYYYAIGTSTGAITEADEKHCFTTRPAAGKEKPTRIWVVADPQGYFDGADRTRDAYLKFTGERGTDVWLLVGDNIYMFEIYRKLLTNIAFWPTIGNHDVSDHGREGVKSYYDNLTLPTKGEAGGEPSGTEKYYSFDYSNIHFICLNSEEGSRKSDGEMVKWLEKDLAATKALWRIAYFHHPPYTRGRYDSDTDGRMSEVRQYLLPVLEKHGVDLVLNGHCHIWQRTGLLNGHYGKSDTITEANKLNVGDGREDGDGVYRKKAGANQGTVYVIAGSCVLGSPKPKEHPAMIKGVSNLGTMVIDVDKGRLDVRYLDATGKTLDYFTIVKTPAEK